MLIIISLEARWILLRLQITVTICSNKFSLYLVLKRHSLRKLMDLNQLIAGCVLINHCQILVISTRCQFLSPKQHQKAKQIFYHDLANIAVLCGFAILIQYICFTIQKLNVDLFYQCQKSFKVARRKVNTIQRTCYSNQI